MSAYRRLTSSMISCDCGRACPAVTAEGGGEDLPGRWQAAILQAEQNRPQPPGGYDRLAPTGGAREHPICVKFARRIRVLAIVAMPWWLFLIGE